MSKPPLFETDDYTQEDCLIVHLDLSLLSIRDNKKDRTDERTLSQTQEEIEGLAQAISLKVLHTHTFKPKTVHAGSYLGKGQREIVADLVEEYQPDVLIFNGALSPIQQRNLEKQWQVKVIDRTGLILEIFGERAQTKEGRLQVELALLEYQKSRLVRSWTHLERQRGGAGFMGGPGETQIEIDRRLISERITRLKQDIADVSRTRELSRQSRARVPFPIVALVGYTNAGKSTLFNSLTNADVMAEDLLFATLDPTMRKLELQDGVDVILADTVGFIANLPTQLVAAFRSTLEQVIYADVILHVIDCAQDDFEIQRLNVIDILADLGVDYEADERIVEVYNKIDKLDADQREEIDRISHVHAPQYLPLSALTGEGQDQLLALLKEHCLRKAKPYYVRIPFHDGRAVSWLYEHGCIISNEHADDGIDFVLRLSETNVGRFQQIFSYDLGLSDDKN